MTMNDADIFSNLEDIFRAIFRDPNMKISPDLSARDIKGWDSIRMIGIILSVEERFGVRFIGREVDSLQTVGDLAALIARRKTS